MTRNVTLAGTLRLLVVVALISSGCGGSGSGTGMSQEEAEAFSKQISQASTGAVQSAHLQAGTTSSALTEPQGLVSCTQAGSCTFNESVSYGVNCTAGGRIGLTGSLTGTMNSSGTGLLQIQVTETITDWQCISGYVVNGDPYISLAGHFSYMNGQPSTAQTMTISGGFKWGTTASESCQIQLTTNFDSSGHGTTSGTVCGHSISISF